MTSLVSERKTDAAEANDGVVVSSREQRPQTTEPERPIAGG
jgi:hypothetical protein